MRQYAGSRFGADSHRERAEPNSSTFAASKVNTQAEAIAPTSSLLAGRETELDALLPSRLKEFSRKGTTPLRILSSSSLLVRY